MADEPEGGAAGAGGGGAAAPKTYTQEELDRLIGERTAQFADYEELKGAAAKLKEIEDSKRSDIEKLTGERDELKNKLTPVEQENLRLRVAVTKKLPAELMDRLKGSTKEEMEADADELLKLVGPDRPDFDGGTRKAALNDGGMDGLIRRAAGRA